MNDLKDFIIEDGVLTKYVGTDANVTVPNYVVQIGPNAFKNNTNIVCVTLPNELTSIGANVFCGCMSLSEIILPSSITQIGNNAFEGCSSLVSMAIPFGVSKIEEGLFKNCTSLTSVSLPEGVTAIGNHEFRRNFDGAFEYCESLKSVNLPESLKLIGANTFRFCTALESVIIPQNVKIIGYDAFVCCGVKTIEYPLSDNSVCAKTTVFDGCDNIETIIAPTSKAYNALWKLLKKDVQVQILKKAITENTTDVNIIKKIKDNRKYLLKDAINSNNAALANFVISVFEIFPLDELNEYIQLASIAVETKTVFMEYKAKYYPSEKIEEDERIRLEKDIGLCERTQDEWKEIFAFESCEGGLYITNYKDNQHNIIIPSKIGKKAVIGIGAECFSSIKGVGRSSPQKREVCQKIETVFLPESIKYIGSSAFAGCQELKTITGITDQIEIAPAAFYMCDSLADENGFIIFNNVLYQYVGSESQAKIPDNVIKIGKKAFSENNNVIDIIIPDSVTSIEDWAFTGCTSLTSITIPDSVTNIGNGLFNRCKNLTSITFSNSVTHYDVSGCKKLKSFTIPDGVTSINFSGCENIKSVTIPDSVTSIENFAFSGCKRLKSITIPDSVTSIGHGAFKGCENLATIIIPNGVTCIDKDVFIDCKSLTNINIPDGVTIIKHGAFLRCTSLTSITIPDSVTNIENNAFCGCKNLTIYAPAGSCAEQYAKENNIPFVAD